MRVLLLALLLLASPAWGQGFGRVHTNEVTVSGFTGADIETAIATCPGSGGCRVRIPAGTYTSVAVDIVAADVPDWLDIVGVGDATLLQAPVPMVAPVFNVHDTASNVTISHLKIDGRKDEQPPMECSDAGTGDYCVNNGFCLAGTCSEGTDYAENIGVKIQDVAADSKMSENISVHHVTFRDLLRASIWAREARGSSFHDNDISDIGCHKLDTDCGTTWNTAYEDANEIGCDDGGGSCVTNVCVGGNRDTLSCCTSDICSPPDLFEPQPNRRANGFGIIFLNNAESGVARDNVATLVTKETYEVFRHNTITDYPNEIRWYGNTATNSSGPFTIVGCDNDPPGETCTSGPTDVHWIGNTVVGTGLTGAMSGWYGFSCSFKSHDIRIEDNVVTDAVGSGFNIACWQDIKLDGNSSNNSCSTGVYTGQNEVQILPTPGADTPYRVTNVSVVGHTVPTTTQCISTIQIEDADNVLLAGGSFADSNAPGIDINDATGVRIMDASLAGPGSGIGVDADDDDGTTTGLVQTGMNDTDCGSGGCITSFTTRVDTAGASGFSACTGTGVPDAECE